MSKTRMQLKLHCACYAAGLWLLAASAAAQDITSSLVAHWTFNDGSGTTALDSTLNSYDGVLVGNPTWQSSAKIVGGLDFETSDGVDRVDAGTFDLAGSGVTLAAWIKPENGFSDGRIIIKSIDNAAAGQLWGLTCENATSIDFRIQAGGTWNLLEVPGAVAAGHWYHVVATYDGTTMPIYVDGVEVGSLVHAMGGAVDINASTKVTLGDSPVGGRTFDGQMDDVRVYDRALTGIDVATLYHTGWGAKTLLMVTANSGS